MKNRLLNFVFFFGVFVLLCIVIYPYTRFAYKEGMTLPGQLKLNETKKELTVGDSFSLYIASIGKRTVTYKSSNFRIASVNLFGKVTANASGRAIISVSYNEETLKCLVLVSE